MRIDRGPQFLNCERTNERGGVVRDLSHAMWPKGMIYRGKKKASSEQSFMVSALWRRDCSLLDKRSFWGCLTLVAWDDDDAWCSWCWWEALDLLGVCEDCPSTRPRLSLIDRVLLTLLLPPFESKVDAKIWHQLKAGGSLEGSPG